MNNPLSDPAREQWQAALAWALLQLTHGNDGHHVRRNEKWDTALLRVAAERLAGQGCRLPVARTSDGARPALQREQFEDLQRVAAAVPPSDDGKVQGNGRRVRPPRRRGWKAA